MYFLSVKCKQTCLRWLSTVGTYVLNIMQCVHRLFSVHIIVLWLLKCYDMYLLADVLHAYDKHQPNIFSLTIHYVYFQNT